MQLPSFSLSDQKNRIYTEADFSKGLSVIYIYPKDMTPGCTLESQDFRDLKPDFDSLGVSVFGLSKDSVESHCRFESKENLNFSLLSDPDAQLISKLGAWKEKSMYGKTFLGIIRSTFLIRDGVIIHSWMNVKAKNHAQEVLDFIRHLSEK